MEKFQPLDHVKVRLGVPRKSGKSCVTGGGLSPLPTGRKRKTISAVIAKRRKPKTIEIKAYDLLFIGSSFCGPRVAI